MEGLCKATCIANSCDAPTEIIMTESTSNQKLGMLLCSENGICMCARQQTPRHLDELNVDYIRKERIIS